MDGIAPVPKEKLILMLEKVKTNLHMANKSITMHRKNDTLQFFRIIWSNVHGFRLDYPKMETELYADSLNAVARHCGYVHLHHTPEKLGNQKELVLLYLVLREYIEQLEKDIARELYFRDTGRISSRVSVIAQAAKRSKKSMITIRRYIRSGKIRAYQIKKVWWIPIEELETIVERGEGT